MAFLFFLAAGGVPSLVRVGLVRSSGALREDEVVSDSSSSSSLLSIFALFLVGGAFFLGGVFFGVVFWIGFLTALAGGCLGRSLDSVSLGGGVFSLVFCCCFASAPCNPCS